MPNNGQPDVAGHDPSAVLPITPAQNREFRQALQKVLDSPAFASSRRLSGFLSYVADAALEGRTELDQYEIAERVLNRHDDFNPLDDASVRKLASQIRHKLEEYYADEGASSPVVITLPRRSYLPRFRYRDSSPVVADIEEIEHGGPEQSVVVQDEQPSPTQIETIPLSHERTVPWRPFALGLLASAVPLAAVLLWTARTPQPAAEERPAPAGTIIINTASGDLRGPILDVGRDAVQIGPPLGSGEEVTTVLRFTPEYPTQQAGVMAFFDADRFVRFGYHFKSRPMMEFGFETEARYRGPESAYRYDPLAQAGISRWLTIRRSEDAYRAFESSDGINWRAFGEEMKLPPGDTNPLAAIYAFNGRSEKPAAEAAFSNFSAGLSFHHREAGPVTASSFPGWSLRSECPERIDARIADGTLQVGYSQAALGCEWQLFRPVPEGDWSFSTLLDFVPVSGSSAGLKLLGTKGNLTVSRRDLMGGSIMLERTDDNDSRVADFRGTPPVILRLRRHQGVITGSFSRDGIRYTTIGEGVAAEQLGDLKGIGPLTSVAHWAADYARPPARFFRIVQDIQEPVPIAQFKARE